MAAVTDRNVFENQGSRRSPPPIAKVARRLRYAAHQGSRVALYTLHSEAMRRMNLRLQKDLPETPKVTPEGPVPSQRRMLADIVKLFAEDMKAVEDGIYPMPSDGTLSPRELLQTSQAFFKDVPKVARRRAKTPIRKSTRTARPLPMRFLVISARTFISRRMAGCRKTAPAFMIFKSMSCFREQRPPCGARRSSRSRKS